MRIFFSIVMAGLTLQAQWLNVRDPDVPRKDGKPNLSAPAPRASNGKPDLSGVWEADGAPISELMKILPSGVNGLGEAPPPMSFFNVLAGIQPEESQLRPEFVKDFQARAAVALTEPPPAGCSPPPLPFADSFPSPFKIVPTPQLTLLLYEPDP